MPAKLELLGIRTIYGKLKVETGLRIGGGRDTVEIGGIDNPVIKHPYTQQPYIPGSSIKGKLRSLLEWALNCVEEDGLPYGANRKKSYSNGPAAGDQILRIFGTTHDSWENGPSRVIVRDAHLDPDWAQRIIRQGLPLTEEKNEVTINRIEGKAASMGPRTMERVPAGAEFRFEIGFKEFAVNGDRGDGDRRCLERLFESMKLLEQDALGGSGSRGYGRVRFQELKLDNHDFQTKFDSIQRISAGQPNRLLED
jgi:CRISPR-associated protein Csm3